MLILHLPVHQFEFENSEKMQPHQNDESPGDLGEQPHMLAQELPDSRSRSPHGDEDRRKTHNEQERRERDLDCPPAPLLAFVREIFQGIACDVAKIGRHQRQDAGRQEAQ